MSSLVPLAEHFHSIQGEGVHVGTPMHFIRTAGCSVGALASREYLKENTLHNLPILNDNTVGSKCRTYDGRFFDCDTNFKRNATMSVEALLAETYEKHICLTGGEPLNHQHSEWWEELFFGASAAGIRIHIETSGTVDIHKCTGAWITVAPKAGVLKSALIQADEVKLLVDEHFDLNNIPSFDDRWIEVFVSPINDEKTVNQANVARCMEILKQRPTWRLSAQWHKFIGVR
jgi:organic radical activating enzyme